jgi:hypothetical protein
MNGHVLSYIATLPCLYASAGWFEVFISLGLDLGTKIDLTGLHEPNLKTESSEST